MVVDGHSAHTATKQYVAPTGDRLESVLLPRTRRSSTLAGLPKIVGIFGLDQERFRW